MKHAVKIIMTVLFSLFCCFVMLIGAGYYFSSRESVSYDVQSMAVPQIIDVQAEKLGDVYQGKTSQGAVYYKLLITLENSSNSMKESYDYFFDYRDEAGEYFGGVMEVRDGLYDSGSGINILPADTTGVITKVVQVYDGCTEFLLVINSYLAKEEQSFLVKL